MALDASPQELREILEAGVHTPFWRLLCEHIDQEWGPGGQRFAARIDALADNVKDDEALAHIRQIAVTRREMLRLVEGPAAEAKRLALQEQKKKDDATLAGLGRVISRGGYR